MRATKSGVHRPIRDQGEKADIRTLKRQDLAIIFPYLKEQKPAILKAILLMILVAITEIVAPLVSIRIIDEAVPNRDLPMISLLGLTFIGIYFFQWMFSYALTIRTTKIAQRVVFGVRQQVYNKILALSLKQHGEHRKGALLSIITNDVDVLSEAITAGIIDFCSDLLSLGGILVVMLFLDVPLTLIALGVILSLLFVIQKLRTSIEKAFITIRRQLARLNVSVEENLAGIRVVQALRVEARKSQDFTSQAHEYVGTHLRAVLRFGVLFAIMSIHGFVSIALVVGVGGLRFLAGKITLGVLMAFFQYIMLLLRPLNNLVQIYSLIEEAAAALLHIGEIIRIPPEVPEPVIPRALPSPLRGQLDVRDIVFSYDERPFMKHLSLSIRPGEKVGLVGETGAGKTTLVNLVARLRDVQGGQITLDGVDLRHIPNDLLRDNLAVVSQTPILFHGTIRQNILFGRPSATDEEVEAAARQAQVDTFVKDLPDGYDTVLGEGGRGISSGQKQLLAYARLILARPKLAILDEATSNIDSRTEALVQQSLQTVLKGCTTLIIAHRYATIRMVDRLVLLKSGRIADEGTHEEIYARNAHYRELYDTQFSRM